MRCQNCQTFSRCWRCVIKMDREVREYNNIIRQQEITRAYYRTIYNNEYEIKCRDCDKKLHTESERIVKSCRCCAKKRREKWFKFW